MSQPLWKRLASVVVEFDETAEVPKKLQQPLGPGPVVPIAAPSLPTSSGALATPAAQADQPTIDGLMKATFARRTLFSGVVETAEKMKAVIKDDTQRIQAAAITAGNVTAPAITQAFGLHEQDLAAERARFNAEIAGAKAAQVEAVLTDATRADREIEAANAEIARLQGVIASATARGNELRAQAQQAEASLQAAAASFEASYAVVSTYVSSMRDAVTAAIAATK